MLSDLGELFRRARTVLRLTPQELARRVGYRNLNKGARRLAALEERGRGTPDFIARVGKALGVANALVAEVWTREEAVRQAEFEAWLNVPQPMFLVEMHIPGVTLEVPLPHGLTEEEAIAFAIARHKQGGSHRICLVVDRRRSFWIGPSGATCWTLATRDRPWRRSAASGGPPN